MLVKVSFIMKFKSKGVNLLGKKYIGKFKAGECVEWRSICRDKNYEEIVKIYQGLILSVFPVDVGSRNVWYAKILKNGGNEEIVLLSKIRKIETN